MGAHFWGQVGATAIDLALVLNIAAHSIAAEDNRMMRTGDEEPAMRFTVGLIGTIAGGVFLCGVIWS